MLNLPQRSFYNTPNPASGARYRAFRSSQYSRNQVLPGTVGPTAVVRYAFYAFIFSVPFESADVEIGGVLLARMLGFILVAIILTVKIFGISRLQLTFPSKASRCFVVYIVLYILLGLNTIWSNPQVPVLADIFTQGIKTILQLFVLFWISYNLMQDERVRQRTLLVLAASCVIVAALQTSGLAAGTKYQDRPAAFDEDPNAMAALLNVGLIILVAYTYRKGKLNLIARLICSCCVIILGTAIVVTGSRGGIVAAAVALFAFFAQARSLAAKAKIALVSLFAVAGLGFISYQIQSVRERWEDAYTTGDTAGRDVIFSTSWEMFLEKPLIGWGPANHIYELGSRTYGDFRGETRSTHNVILWVLIECGLLGAVAFFAGLWFCWRATWNGRYGRDRALPLSLLICVLMSGMTITNHTTKTFWFVLAYALASGISISKTKRVARQGHLVAAHRPLPQPQRRPLSSLGAGLRNNIG